MGAYCFFLGGNSGVIFWCAKKQKTVTQSMCNAEYIAVGEAACECQWLHKLTESIGLPQISPTPLLCDNDAALILSKDPSVCPMSHRKTMSLTSSPNLWLHPRLSAYAHSLAYAINPDSIQGGDPYVLLPFSLSSFFFL